MTSPTNALRTGRRALAALTSPARQEVLGALAEGPATARALAERLGRSRQALYHHLGVLERAGLVRAAGEVGEGRGRETVYGVCAEGLRPTDAPASRGEVRAAARASQAMLRLTSREVSEAIVASGLRRAGPERELVAVRAKVRLSPERLRRLNELLDAVHELVASTAAAVEGDALFAVTLVLTPAREARPERAPRATAPPRPAESPRGGAAAKRATSARGGAAPRPAKAARGGGAAGRPAEATGEGATARRGGR